MPFALFRDAGLNMLSVASCCFGGRASIQEVNSSSVMALFLADIAFSRFFNAVALFFKHLVFLPLKLQALGKGSFLKHRSFLARLSGQQ